MAMTVILALVPTGGGSSRTRPLSSGSAGVVVDRMPTKAEIVAPAAGATPGLDYFARLYWLIIESHDYQARGLTP